MKSPKINVLAFTDPYCSWCWATEPMILSMMEKYRDQIHFEYVFGGLVEDMSKFYDSSNDIGTAAAVVPHWKMVSERSGQPIDENLWVDLEAYPHFSTWPANIAAKAAFLQSQKVGERYLRRLRRAALTERRIISNEGVYLPLARETEELDVERFESDINSEKAAKAFEADMKTSRAWQAFGFPTMLFYKADADVNNLTKEDAVYVNGHRPMETYEQVLAMLEPNLKKHNARLPEELIDTYGPMTTRELAQVYEESTETAEKSLREKAAGGKLKATELVRGTLWS